ncbi:hypothetical protein HZA96_02065 [Candidatus Woesearchaeota archaeon]|nr:hypothetical protein [Candidatus Woesearchaeota archaeon]
MKKKIVLAVLFILTIFLIGCVSNIEKQQKANEDLVCIPKSALQKGGVLNVSDIESLINPVNPAAEKKSAQINAVNTTAAKNETSATSPATIVTNPATTITKAYTEGDTVQLTPKATDGDKDTVTFSYSAPLNKEGKWQTKAGDAGEYVINVTASDGKSTVTKQVKIIVQRLNQPPTISIEDVVVKEGETIELKPKVSDPELKEVKVYYSGWMDKATKTTTFTDAGTYIVTITASDGEKSAFKNITVIVRNVNRAPVLSGLIDITAKEGDLVTLKPVVSDPDQDAVSVNYTKPLNKDGQWQTKKGDAGNYEVKVAATDGDQIVSQRVKIIIQILNHPPVIEKIQDMLVQVGETVTLNPVISDADGDKVVITFSGWMTTSTKTTASNDAGKHIVTITADDGKEKTMMTVNVEVNSPPEFEI